MVNTYEQEQVLFYQLQNKLVALKYRPGAAKAVTHYADLENRALDVADRAVENIKACVVAARRDRRHQHHTQGAVRRWEELNRMCRELAAEARRMREETVRAQVAWPGGRLCSGSRICRRRKGAKELCVPSSFAEET